MSFEIASKVGRGGAGNFYSKKEIEDIAKQQAEDVEAQKTPSTNDYTTTTAPPPDFAHIGRGGAGNYYQPAELAKDMNPEGPKVSTEKKTIKRKGYGGRGGAGNFQDDAEADARQAAQEEESARHRLDERVRQDVEAGLRRPKKAYAGAWTE